MLTVPASVDYQLFCKQYERGLTEDEWAHYTQMAAAEFMRQSEAVKAKALADRQVAAAANPAPPDESTTNDRDNGRKP